LRFAWLSEDKPMRRAIPFSGCSFAKSFANDVQSTGTLLRGPLDLRLPASARKYP